jgi:hypothetical protein
MSQRAIQLVLEAIEFTSAAVDRKEYPREWDGIYSGKLCELMINEFYSICASHPTWSGSMLCEEIKKHFEVENG